MALFLKVCGFTRGAAAPKTVDSFRVTFYDLDAGLSKSSREFLVADDMNPSTERTMDSQIEMTSKDGGAEFIATHQDSGKDNPKDSKQLLEKQKARSVVSGRGTRTSNTST